MIARVVFFFSLFFLSGFQSWGQPLVKTPDEFLQYPYGSRFTPHHLLVSYFQYVDEVSDHVMLVEYGRTYELRPLIAAIISSPENLNRLEEIRLNNLRRSKMVDGEVTAENIAIVYLSYSVHGNEAAGSESSIAVLHALAKGDKTIEAWLKNTIVIIDPCLNPDGYTRYTQWNNSVSNSPFNLDDQAREHDEPWPGGRTNHYYSDLNRDWAWQTQKESRERLAFYLSWMPHVHADLHEMNNQSTYYFAPAAQPYHTYLTPWQSQFQVEIGKNHAAYFDREGWSYFTKEVFDLFYPSYGDTYPMLSGAIGMTYEQAGSGAAGRAILTDNGDTLKLIDRIQHHYTTSLSTVEMASKHASRVVKEFSAYYNNAVHHPQGKYRSYIIRQTNNPGRLHDLLLLLDKNKIQYGMLGQDGKSTKGFSYLHGTEETFNPQQGDIIIPVGQPRSVLLNVLFEPESDLADSLTYDITAWSVPMAYGLEAYATTEIFTSIPYNRKATNLNQADLVPYAYAIPWGSLASAKLLATLLKEGVVARYAMSAFRVNEQQYDAGTVLLMRADNRKFADFDSVVRTNIQNAKVPVSVIQTGFVDTGRDLGSSSYKLIRKPSVATFSGPGVSSLNLGQVWHFFEEELGYPVNIIEIESLTHLNLNHYNLLILPEGNYSLAADTRNKLNDYMRSGGQIIAIGSALRNLSGTDGLALNMKQNVKELSDKEVDPAHFPEQFDAAHRNAIAEDIGGAVFKTHVDKSHPLGFGLGEIYWTLKTDPVYYSWLPAGGNAIFLNNELKHFGFVGSQALTKIDQTLVAGSERIGQGGIVYLVDNPLFRSFWYSGKVLFSNALFF